MNRISCKSNNFHNLFLKSPNFKNSYKKNGSYSDFSENKNNNKNRSKSFNNRSRISINNIKNIKKSEKKSEIKSQDKNIIDLVAYNKIYASFDSIIQISGKYEYGFHFNEIISVIYQNGLYVSSALKIENNIFVEFRVNKLLVILTDIFYLKKIKSMFYHNMNLFSLFFNDDFINFLKRNDMNVNEEKVIEEDVVKIELPDNFVNELFYYNNKYKLEGSHNSKIKRRIAIRKKYRYVKKN